VDETDIGRVREKQAVMIKLDAYPDVNVRGRVGLISYESKITNNVTMYEVDIIPEEVPAVYRSGMSADIDIIETTKESALLLPIDAVVNENMKSYVWVMPGKDARPVKREVSTGIADDQNIEITGGIKDDDRIAVISQKVIQLDKKEGTNPFMPQRPKRMR
jgi:macrolide-specific efflux system membrane fusion protein